MPRLLTMSVALPTQRYQVSADRITFYERLNERLSRVAPITSMAIASALPFGGAAPRQLAVDGVPTKDGGTAHTVWTVIVGPRYFETIGLPLLRGRAFDDRDGATGYENVIINERFAELHFPNADPIGRRIRLTATGTSAITPRLTIVGISPTIPQRTVPERDPVVYLSFRQEPPAAAAVIVRGRSEPAPIAPLVREEVRALDPDLPLYRVMTLEQAVIEAQWNGRTSNFLIIVITCIAVCLAAIGLYAVTSHSVAQQMKEIGIRMAIGAQPYQLGWLVVRRAMIRLGLGLAFGLAATMAWERLFASYSTNTLRLFDPLNLILLTAVLILVSAAACLWPVRRATNLDPIAVLRHE
jgi:putative ABC transport system permease protein